MLSFAERALGLNGKELRRALPIFAYLFLTMASSVASKATRDALFLDRYRAIDLPYVDIAIAVLVGIAASAYIWFGYRTNLRNLQVGSLTFFAVTALGFWLWAAVAAYESGALFIVIYIWVGVFSVLAPSQVWTLANYVLTTREAKRSFGFIGSGAILGWIVGGFATRTAVSQFGTESMLGFVAITLVLCAVLVVVIWRERPDYVGNETPASGNVKDRFPLWGALRLIRESAYLRAIAALILIAALTTTIAGWQFKAIAKAAVPDTDELAMFFGTFNMIAGVMSLVLQLLLTGRVLRTVGVGPALFIVPTAMLMGSAGVLMLGTLVAAASLKASDQVLRYSIDKATVELLYLPVPAAHTFRVKSFIDTVVYRLGDASGGMVVLLFAAVLGWSPVQMSMVGAVFVGFWMMAAYVARRQYVENLRESIHQHRVDSERASMPVMDRDTASIISSRLKGTPKQIAYALSLFELAHDRKVHPAVRGLLRHEDAAIRQQAVRLLARAGDATVKDQVEPLVKDPDLGVRTEALLYLTAFDPMDPLQRIEALGDFEDFSIQAALVAFLARPGRAQNLDAAKLLLSKMVEEKGDAGRRARLEAARLLSILPDAFDRELRELVDDEDLRRGEGGDCRGWRAEEAVAPRRLDRSARRTGAESSGDRRARLVWRSHCRHAARLPDRRVDARRGAARDSEGARGNRLALGAGGADRERARSRRRAALSHHRRAQPPRPGASGSNDRQQADRERAGRGDHGALPLVSGPWHPGWRAQGLGESHRARIA